MLKKTIIKRSQKHKKDTGSAKVQIALLIKKITDLTKHLRKHKKDNHSRRGLLQMVAKKRKLEKYIKNSKKNANNKT